MASEDETGTLAGGLEHSYQKQGMIQYIQSNGIILYTLYSYLYVGEQETTRSEPEPRFPCKSGM